MTFEEFQATKIECIDINAALNQGCTDHAHPALRGLIYLGSLAIKEAPNGEWHLRLGANEWTSADLAALERMLYDFAESVHLTDRGRQYVG